MPDDLGLEPRLARPRVPLRYGALAPDFTLPATRGSEIALSSYRGHADAVLVFYCYDWGRI
jgi:peroxiredoxin